MSEQPIRVNPLLKPIQLPGSTYRIPTSGAFYTNQLAPTVKNGEIHIYPMRAIDEIVMRSPDKLLSGDAIREVFARCIPDIVDVDNMFAKDVDAIMIALRKVTYGEAYEFSYTHDCDNAIKHSYSVAVDTFLSNSAIDQVQFVEQHKYTVQSTGQTISFQPLRFKDIVDLMNESVEDQSTDASKKRSLMPEPVDNFAKQRTFFKSLLASINSVDGITDKDLIVEWLDTLPAPEVTKILEQIDVVSNWGPNYKVKVRCRDCGEEVEINVPVNPLNFFI